MIVVVFDVLTSLLGPVFNFLAFLLTIVFFHRVFIVLKISDLEKEKTMLELEVKELIARHKTDLQEKTSKVTQVSILHVTGLFLPSCQLITTCLCWAEHSGKACIIFASIRSII